MSVCRPRSFLTHVTIFFAPGGGASIIHSIHLLFSAKAAQRSDHHTLRITTVSNVVEVAGDGGESGETTGGNHRS